MKKPSRLVPQPSRRRRPRVVQRVNVDFPIPMLERIDAEAARSGVARQAWIKFHLGTILDARTLRERADHE